MSSQIGKLCPYNNLMNKIMWQMDRPTDARRLVVYCLYNFYLFIYLFIAVIYPVESQ
jgi:hypothetical protein